MKRFTKVFQQSMDWEGRFLSHARVLPFKQVGNIFAIS